MYGKTKYTSMEFSNIAFKVQTRTLTDIDIDTVSHKPVVVTENEVKATCKQEGHYDKVTFHLGYAKNRPSMTFALDKIMISRGKPEWGAEEGKLYFVIHLGQRLS